MLIFKYSITLALAVSAVALPTYLEEERRDDNSLSQRDDVLLFDGLAFPDPDKPGETRAYLQAFVSMRRAQTGFLAKAIIIGLKAKGISVAKDQAKRLKERVKLISALGFSRRKVEVEIPGCPQLVKLQDTSGFSNLGLVRQNVPLGSCNPNDPHLLTGSVKFPNGDSRSVQAKIYRSPDSGFGVISDIDDTVKISNVLDSKALMQSTLLDEPKVVPGMPQLYKSLATTLDSPPFVYVSGSPFQLYPFLHNFIDSSYPDSRGPIMLYNLTMFDPTDVIGFISNGGQKAYDHKKAVMTNLRSFYPNKKWLMIGDSTQKDPEVYNEMYKQFGDSMVQCIWIRRVDKADNTAERFTNALKDVPKNKYRLYTDGEIPSLEKLKVRDGEC